MDIDGVYYCSRCMRKREDEEGVCPHCGYQQPTEENPFYLGEGTLLGERYIFGAVIGSGGYGVTYAAWDLNLRVPVAIKEYFPGHLARRNVEESSEIVPNPADEALYRIELDRFRREAQILAQLRNIPGVVNVYEQFEDNGTCYIAMEYVHGVTLDVYVQQHKPDAKTLLAMMRGPIQALEIIHKQGVHHRDITPRNLIVQEDGTVKLIDFGAAREIAHKTNLIVASDGYAPIEQYDMERQQGPWGDIYSLSATLYHMITGVRPPSSLTRVKRDALLPPKKLGVKLKKHEERALMLGLALHPEKRVRSMEEFASILYNTPLPEEARRRRAFMRRVYAVMAGITAVFALIVYNFAVGFPLGKGLLYALHGDGWHVVGATQEKAEVVIPERVLFLPVSAIEPDVFAGSDVLEAVTVPGGVDTIEPYTFSGCTNLKVATLEEGVRWIEDYAFSDCAQLHTVNVPGSIGGIGHYAFDGAWERVMLCSQDKLNNAPVMNHGHAGYYVRADYTYTPVEGGVELAQRDPQSIYWDEWDAEYILPSFIDGQKVVAMAEDFEFPWDCEHITLPTYLQYIPESWIRRMAFPLLKSVNLGEALQEIPDGAFYAQRQLTEEIRIPDTVQRIGVMAFENTPLRRIVLPANLRSVDDQAFHFTQINEIELPEKLWKIGSSSFAGTSLYSVDFPEDLKEIGAYAFMGTPLCSVNFPSNLWKIGERAFSITDLTSIELTIDLDGLGEEAFYDCQVLEYVKIHAVDRNPFENPEDNQNMLAEKCFAECPLGEVSLTGAVKELGAACFEGSWGLEYVSLPEGMERIGERVFADCRELCQVIIPDSVTFIDDTAFEGAGKGWRPLCLIGSEGSYAQAYAEKHGIHFIPGLDIIKSQFENGEYDVSALPFEMPE